MPERLNDVEIAEDAAIIKIEGGELVVLMKSAVTI